MFPALICTLYSQDGTSEEFLSEWAEKRGIRDQLVIATKVRTFRVAYFRYARDDGARFTLHLKLQAWRRRYCAEGQLRREQHQVYAR